mgnify:CR=1 FL=1
MMRSLKNRIAFAPSVFAGARSGVAATEFALIVPVLLTLFFGVVEGSDALATSRRVSLAANTLADLAAQESELLMSEVDDLFDGVVQIVDTNGDPMTVRLVSVIADPDGDPVVDWSRDNSGGAPYAKGAAYDGLPDPSLLDVNASMIIAEISYPYTSGLTHYLISSVTFEKSATRWPRRSLRVKLCTSPGVCG